MILLNNECAKLCAFRFLSLLFKLIDFNDDNKPYLAPYDPINNEVEIYLYEDEYYRGDMFGLRRTPHDKV